MPEIQLERQQEPARLRIYLGAAPGVGKTYHMLNDALLKRKQGVDVAIGLVETHRRQETTDQIRDLEIVPLRVIPYRGVDLKEMDVDAVLARHPQIAIVDELAHTNAPGSRHPKRYLDVEELLSKGIDQVNQTEQRAGQLSDAFQRGEPGVELSQVMVQMQKAQVSFRALTEVRNRLVSAYQDIMNMQI